MGVPVFNRRTFLKTSAAALPLTALSALNPASALAEEHAAATFASGPTPKLVPLPARLAPVDHAGAAMAAKGSPRRTKQHDRA